MPTSLSGSTICRFAAKALAIICLAQPNVDAAAISIDWVTVGDPNNAADTSPSGYGAVSDSFRIMKFEFTNEQYKDFLNSVAATDTCSL